MLIGITPEPAVVGHWIKITTSQGRIFLWKLPILAVLMLHLSCCYNDGAAVGNSGWMHYADWTTLSWDCPVDAGYEVVDEVQIYVAADNFYRADSGSGLALAKVRNFVSDAVVCSGTGLQSDFCPYWVWLV